MSLPSKQYESLSVEKKQSHAVSISEGDWPGYLAATINCSKNILSREALEEVIERKRACALAYLGRRAQKHGGVCSRTQPRILTMQMIGELGKTNADLRYKRYPWLEKLLKLMADIESIQDDISMQSNVISMTGNLNDFSGANNRRAIPPMPIKSPAFSFDATSRA
ncbi:MAG: hypothetical protein H7315_03830 [Herminiimonas sp.]|nr:hypothetical protein [Herminiimonas sp.]